MDLSALRRRACWLGAALSLSTSDADDHWQWNDVEGAWELPYLWRGQKPTWRNGMPGWISLGHMVDRDQSMTRIEVPEFTPCGSCANGRVLKHGKTEFCGCWIDWWASVRESILGRGVEPLVRVE